MVQANVTRRVIVYRRHRLTLARVADRGWSVAIRPPREVGRGRSERLSNSVPHGAAILIQEARRRIDRRLDGAPWQEAP